MEDFQKLSEGGKTPAFPRLRFGHSVEQVEGFPHGGSATCLWFGHEASRGAFSPKELMWAA
jgi:hypothetical protein